MSKMTLFVRQSEFTKEDFRAYIDGHADEDTTYRITRWEDPTGDWWKVTLPSSTVRDLVRVLDRDGKDYDYE